MKTLNVTWRNLKPATEKKPLPPAESAAHDPVNNPKHYTDHKSGVECIQIAEHMNFCLENALRYIWRADLKGNAIEDLEKARWYLNREIERRKKSQEAITRAST